MFLNLCERKNKIWHQTKLVFNSIIFQGVTPPMLTAWSRSGFPLYLFYVNSEWFFIEKLYREYIKKDVAAIPNAKYQS